jgi:hypothetical protein
MHGLHQKAAIPLLPPPGMDEERLHRMLAAIVVADVVG